MLPTRRVFVVAGCEPLEVVELSAVDPPGLAVCASTAMIEQVVSERLIHGRSIGQGSFLQKLVENLKALLIEVLIKEKNTAARALPWRLDHKYETYSWRTLMYP